jgi:hypothetical protein
MGMLPPLIGSLSPSLAQELKDFVTSSAGASARVLLRPFANSFATLIPQ